MITKACIIRIYGSGTLTIEYLVYGYITVTIKGFSHKCCYYLIKKHVNMQKDGKLWLIKNLQMLKNTH